MAFNAFWEKFLIKWEVVSVTIFLETLSDKSATGSQVYANVVTFLMLQKPEFVFHKLKFKCHVTHCKLIACGLL